MEFISISSSSEGNSYILKNCNNLLLLECGISPKKLIEKGYKLKEINACLVSHEHKDHAGYVNEYLKHGIDIYMSNGTKQALKLPEHHRLHMIADGLSKSLSNNGNFSWKIRPFKLIHDAQEPLGYLISDGKDILAFIPDTADVPYIFKDVSIFAIECNYVTDILIEKTVKKDTQQNVAHRVRRNHMSLENVIKFLKSHDLRKCKQIYLLHLSSINSDENIIKQKVQEATGVSVYICSDRN